MLQNNKIGGKNPPIFFDSFNRQINTNNVIMNLYINIKKLKEESDKMIETKKLNDSTWRYIEEVF